MIIAEDDSSVTVLALGCSGNFLLVFAQH